MDSFIQGAIKASQEAQEEKNNNTTNQEYSSSQDYQKPENQENNNEEVQYTNNNYAFNNANNNISNQEENQSYNKENQEQPQEYTIAYSAPITTQHATAQINVVNSYSKLNLVDDELEQLLAHQQANIKVVGCGGGGCNTINRISEVGVVGAQTIAVNTDAQDLLYTGADKKLLIGRRR